jgi:hypothetical protein
MLWALLSSAYVIYLYRKLNAEGEPQATTMSKGSPLDAELATLDERIASLESHTTKSEAGDTAS